MSYYPYPTQVMVNPPRRTSTAHLVIAWIAALFTALYLLPWAVAATRNKSNTGAIALVNLFLGWSLIGWVVALVMSCSAENNQPQVVVMNGHGFPAYPVEGQPQFYGQPYPHQTSAHPAHLQVRPYAPAALPAPYASSPATTPFYPTSAATAPYPTSAATASGHQPWDRPVDRVSTETVPLFLADPYARSAAEITRALPAPSDPPSDEDGRQ